MVFLKKCVTLYISIIKKYKILVITPFDSIYVKILLVSNPLANF